MTDETTAVHETSKVRDTSVAYTKNDLHLLGISFPVQTSAFPHDLQMGLTKREWYAGLAMQGLMARTDWDKAFDSTAHDACKMADELMAALNPEMGNNL